MLINWVTVIAQALNFFILVWLIKRFLYKPILDAIDAREKLIAIKLEDAENKKNDAQKESDELKYKNKEFDQQREILLSKAKKGAEKEHQRILDEARQVSAALKSKQMEMLKNETNSLNKEIKERTQQEVFFIAKKALSDLAGTDLEARACEIFISRLREMKDSSKNELSEILKKTNALPVVRSAFSLAVVQQEAIQNALNEIFLAKVNIQFETKPSLISGVELSFSGHKVSWSIADYLVLLKEEVDKLLRNEDKIRG